MRDLLVAEAGDNGGEDVDLAPGQAIASFAACRRRRCRLRSTMSATASRPTQNSPAITARMAFISNCVAASFITTPRAFLQRLDHLTTLYRRGEDDHPGLRSLSKAASSRIASIPGMRGMARSSSRMSGVAERLGDRLDAVAGLAHHLEVGL